MQQSGVPHFWWTSCNISGDGAIGRMKPKLIAKTTVPNKTSIEWK
jgi:hypothetical protein